LKILKVLLKKILDFYYLMELKSKLKNNKYLKKLSIEEILEEYKNPYTLKSSIIDQINQLNEKEKKEILNKQPYFIFDMWLPSQELKLKALSVDGFVLKGLDRISYTTEEMKLVAIKRNPNIIKHIKNPSELVQLAAVSQDGMLLEYIEGKKSRIVKLEAVKQNGLAISLINFKYRTNELGLIAVKQNGLAIQYLSPTEEMKLEAIKQNPKAIQYIKNPSEELLKLEKEIMKKEEKNEKK